LIILKKRKIIKRQVENEDCIVEIDGERFCADSKMIQLLYELNKIGLKTTQHCYGHQYDSKNIDSPKDYVLRSGKKKFFICKNCGESIEIEIRRYVEKMNNNGKFICALCREMERL